MNFFFSSKKSSGVPQHSEEVNDGPLESRGASGSPQASSFRQTQLQSTPITTDVGAEAALWTALRLVTYHYEKLFVSTPHERVAPRSVGSSRLQFDPNDQSLGSSRRGPVSTPENNGSASFQKSVWTYLEQLHLMEIAVQRGLEIRYAKRERRFRTQDESNPLINSTDDFSPLESTHPDEQQPNPAHRGTSFSDIVSTPFVAADDGVPLGKVIPDDDPHNYKNRQRHNGPTGSSRSRTNNAGTIAQQTVEEQVLALLAEDEPEETNMVIAGDSASSSLTASSEDVEIESNSDEDDGRPDQDVEVSASWSVDVIVAVVQAGVQHCIFHESGVALVAMEEVTRSNDSSAGHDSASLLAQNGIPWSVVAQWAAVFALLLRRSHKHARRSSLSSLYGTRSKTPHDGIAGEEVIDSDDEEEESQAVTAALQLALRPLVQRLWNFIVSELASYHKSMVNRWLNWGSSSGSKHSSSNSSGVSFSHAASDSKSALKSAQGTEVHLQEQQLTLPAKATRLCAALTLIRIILSSIRVPLYTKEAANVGNTSVVGSAIPIPARLSSHLPAVCRAAFLETLPWLLWAASYTLFPGNTSNKNKSALLNYGALGTLDVLSSEHLKLLRYGILAHVDESAAASISSSAPSNSASAVIALDPSTSGNKHPSYGVSGAVVVASPVPLPAAAASSTQTQFLTHQYAPSNSFSLNLSHPCTVRRAAVKALKLLIELGFSFQLGDTLKLLDAVLSSLGAQEPSFRGLYREPQSVQSSTEESTQWDAGEVIGYLMAFIQTGRSECSMRDIRNIMEGLLNVSKTSESDPHRKRTAVSSEAGGGPATSEGSSIVMLLSPASSSSHRHLQQQLGMHWSYVGNPRRPKDSLLISVKLLSTRGGVQESHWDRRWLAISISTFLYTTALPLSETVHISLVAVCRSLFSAVKALYRGKPAVQLRNELCRVAEIVAEAVRLWADRLDDGSSTLVLLNGLVLVLGSVKAVRQEEPHLLLATLLALRSLIIPRLSCTNATTKELLPVLMTLHREEALHCLQQRTVEEEKSSRHSVLNTESTVRKGNFDPLWSLTESCEVFADILGELIGWIAYKDGSLADRHWIQAALDKATIKYTTTYEQSVAEVCTNSRGAESSTTKENAEELILTFASSSMKSLIELHRHLHRFFCMPEELLSSPEIMLVLMKMAAHLGENSMRLFKYGCSSNGSLQYDGAGRKINQIIADAEVPILLLSVTQLSFFFQTVVVLFNQHAERLGMCGKLSEEKNNFLFEKTDSARQKDLKGIKQDIKRADFLRRQFIFLVFHYMKWFTTSFSHIRFSGFRQSDAGNCSSFTKSNESQSKSDTHDDFPANEMILTVWRYISRRVAHWGFQALEVLIVNEGRNSSVEVGQEDVSVDDANTLLSRTVASFPLSYDPQIPVSSSDIEELLLVFLENSTASTEKSEDGSESDRLKLNFPYECRCDAYSLISKLWLQRHLHALSQDSTILIDSQNLACFFNNNRSPQPSKNLAEKQDERLAEQQSGSTTEKVSGRISKYFLSRQGPQRIAGVVFQSFLELERLSSFGLTLPMEVMTEVDQRLQLFQRSSLGFSLHERVILNDKGEGPQLFIHQQASESENNAAKVEPVGMGTLLQLGVLSIRVGVEGICELAREEMIDTSAASQQRYNTLEEVFVHLMSMLQKTVQMGVNNRGEDGHASSVAMKGSSNKCSTSMSELSAKHFTEFKKRIEFTSLAWNALLLVHKLLEKIFSIKKSKKELKFQRILYERESLHRNQLRQSACKAGNNETIGGGQPKSESVDRNGKGIIESILENESPDFSLLDRVLSGTTSGKSYCNHQRLGQLVLEHAPVLYRVAHSWGQWTSDDRVEYVKYCHREMEKPTQHKSIDPHQCHTMRVLSPTTISLLSAEVCSSLIAITGEEDVAAQIFSETVTRVYPDDQQTDTSDNPYSTHPQESSNAPEKQSHTKEIQTFLVLEEELKNEQSLVWGTWVVVCAFSKARCYRKTWLTSTAKRNSRILSEILRIVMNTSTVVVQPKSGSPGTTPSISSMITNDLQQEEHQQILMNSVFLFIRNINEEHHEVLKRKYDRRQLNSLVKSLRNLLRDASRHKEEDSSSEKNHLRLEQYIKGVERRIQEEEERDDRQDECRCEVSVSLWSVLESVLLATCSPLPFLWINEQHSAVLKVLYEIFRSTHIVLLPPPHSLHHELFSRDERLALADHEPASRRRNDNVTVRNILPVVGRVAHCLSRAIHFLTLSPHLSPSNVSEPISSAAAVREAVEFHELCTADSNLSTSIWELVQSNNLHCHSLDENVVNGATRVTVSNGKFSAFYYRHAPQVVEPDSFFPAVSPPSAEFQRREDEIQLAVELSDRLSRHIFLRLYMFSLSSGPLRAVSAPFVQVGGAGGFQLHRVLSPLETTVQDTIELSAPRPVKNPYVSVHLARLLRYLYTRSAIFGIASISETTGVGVQLNESHSNLPIKRNTSRTSFGEHTRVTGRNSLSDVINRGGSAAPEGSRTPGNLWAHAPPIFPLPTTILCKTVSTTRNTPGANSSPSCFPAFLLPAIPFVCPSPPLRGFCVIGNTMYREATEQAEWNSVIREVVENNVVARCTEAFEKKKSKPRGRSSGRSENTGNGLRGGVRRNSMSLSNFGVSRSATASLTPASPSQPFSPLLPSMAKLLSKRINTSTTVALMAQAANRGFFDVRQTCCWAHLQLLLKVHCSSTAEQHHVGWFSVSRNSAESNDFQRSTGANASEQAGEINVSPSSPSSHSAIGAHSHDIRNNPSMSTSFSQQSVSSLGLNDAGNLIQPHHHASGDFVPEEMSLNSSLQGMNPFPRNHPSGSRQESDLWSQTDVEENDDERTANHLQSSRERETTLLRGESDGVHRRKSVFTLQQRHFDTIGHQFLVGFAGRQVLLFYMDTLLDCENQKINALQNKQTYLSSSSSEGRNSFPFFHSQMNTTCVKIGVPPRVLSSLITALDITEEAPGYATRNRVCHLLLVVLEQFPSRTEYENLREKIREVQLYREKREIHQKEKQHVEEAERVGWVKGQTPRRTRTVEAPRPPYQKALRQRLLTLEKRMVSILELVPQLLAAVTNFSRRSVFYTGERTTYQRLKNLLTPKTLADSSSRVESPLETQQFGIISSQNYPLSIIGSSFCLFRECNIVALWQSIAESTLLSPSGAKRMIRALTVILHAEDKLQEKYHLFSTGLERVSIASLLLWSAGYFASQKESIRSKILNVLNSARNSVSLRIAGKVESRSSSLFDWRKDLAALEVKEEEWRLVCEAIRSALLAQPASQLHVYHLFQRIIHAVVNRLQFGTDRTCGEQHERTVESACASTPDQQEANRDLQCEIQSEIKKFLHDKEAEWAVPLFFRSPFVEEHLEDHGQRMLLATTLLRSLEAFTSLWVNESYTGKPKKNSVKENQKEASTHTLAFGYQMSTSLRDIVGTAAVLLMAISFRYSGVKIEKSETPILSGYSLDLDRSSFSDHRRRCFQCVSILLTHLSSRHQDLITELIFTYLRVSHPNANAELGSAPDQRYTKDGVQNSSNALPKLPQLTSFSSESPPCSPPFHETAPPSPMYDCLQSPFANALIADAIPLSEVDCAEGKRTEGDKDTFINSPLSKGVRLPPSTSEEEEIWWSALQLVAVRCPRIEPIFVHDILTLYVGKEFPRVNFHFRSPIIPISLFTLVLRATAIAVVRSKEDAHSEKSTFAREKYASHLTLQQVASDLQQFLELLVTQISVEELLGILGNLSEVGDVEDFFRLYSELLGIQKGDEEAVTAFVDRETRDQKSSIMAMRTFSHEGMINQRNGNDANQEQKYIKKERDLISLQILMRQCEPHSQEEERSFARSSALLQPTFGSTPLIDKMAIYWGAVYANLDYRPSYVLSDSLCTTKNNFWYAASLSPSAAMLTELALNRQSCKCKRCDHSNKDSVLHCAKSSLMTTPDLSALSNANAMNKDEQSVKVKGIEQFVSGIVAVSHPFQLLHRLWGTRKFSVPGSALKEELTIRKIELERKAFAVMRYCIQFGSSSVLTIPCFEISTDVSAEWKLNLLVLLATAEFEEHIERIPNEQVHLDQDVRTQHRLRLEPLVLFLMHRYLLDEESPQKTTRESRLASFLRFFVFLMRISEEHTTAACGSGNHMVFNSSRLGAWISQYLVRFYFKEFPEEGKNAVRQLSQGDHEILRSALRSAAEELP